LPRILIDVTRLLYRRCRATLPTGIDRVGLAYVRRYGEDARAVLSLGPFGAVLSARDSAAVFRAVSADGAAVRVLALVLVAKAVLWRWMAGGVDGAVLLNTGHTGLGHPDYAWTLRARGARLVTFVHDLIPLTHPEFCRPREFAAHRVRMRCAALRSAGIVANSRHTLESLARFCAGEGIALPPAAVAHLGEGLPRLPPRDRPLAAPYFVVLGTLEARKNHAMLLHVWRGLAASLGAGAPRLVLIGQRGWECENVVDLLERCQPLRGLVIEKPRCGDAELATWLHHAQALLFPSCVAGYGLPLGEALSRGVPVIASDLPAFREIAGDAPEYADPLDGPRWAWLVQDFARDDSALRAAAKARAQAFRPATWESHFAIVGELLERLGLPADARPRPAAGAMRRDPGSPPA
jgi:glycosyltransferase involved in cell wall biosynthesis